MLRSQLRHLPLQRVSLTLMTQHAVQSTTARNAPMSVWVRQFSDMKNRVVKGDDVVKVNLRSALLQGRTVWSEPGWLTQKAMLWGFRMGLLDKRMITPKEGSVVEFKVGANQLILQKVEEEVVGMKIAQRKDFICSAAEAFGELNVALFPFIPANELPPTYMQDLEVFHKVLIPPSLGDVMRMISCLTQVAVGHAVAAKLQGGAGAPACSRN